LGKRWDTSEVMMYHEKIIVPYSFSHLSDESVHHNWENFARLFNIYDKMKKLI